MVTEYNLVPNTNDTIIQAWHSGAVKTATSMGYRVIASDYEHLYMDCGPHAPWCAPYKSWERMYGYDPTAGLSRSEARLVMGATACLWSETIKRDNLDAGITINVTISLDLFR